MSRSVHADTLAALAGHFCPALLVEVDWPDGVVRMHSGFQVMIWGGHDWQPVGNFGRVDMPQEAGGLPAGGATMTWVDTVERTEELLGIPFADLRGRLVKIWVAAVTVPRGAVIIGAPISLYTGYFDARTFSLSRAGDELQRTLQFSLADGVPARTGMRAVHSPEDQAAKFPGDTGFRHTIVNLRKASNPDVW